MTFKSGDLIRNRYRIIHPLSDSSYRAMDMSLRQSCLIKEFSGTTSERVTQLASLQHPNLPRVIDLVREGDQTLLVMDLVDGISLSERMLQSDEPIPADEYEPWLIELTQTLEYLHQQEPPVSHGDVLIDHVVLRPDGSIALVHYSSYSRQPADDIKGLGMMVGYLVSHTLPTISADQMVITLTGRKDRTSQTALAMLTGQVERIDNVLRGRLTKRSPIEAQQSERANEGDASLEEDAPSTVPLANRLGGDQEENGPVPSQPVMPWDKEEDGPSTVEWGARVSDSMGAADFDPSEPVSQNLSTVPFEDSLPATEVLDSSVPTSDLLREVAPQTGPPPAAGLIPKIEQLKEEEKESLSPEYESRFDGDQEAGEEGSGGFNWLWIIVAIMAGVILLCLACLAIGIYFAEDEGQLQTLDESNSSPALTADEATATSAASLTDDFEEGLTQNEPEPTSTIINQNERVNKLAAGVTYRNDEYGYQFELPARFEILEEVDGSITLEAISGADDKGIFLAVFPLTTDSTAETLMGQLIESAEAEGGTVYGDPTAANYNDLSGLSVAMNVPSGDDGIGPLLGQMITLENREASVLVVATSAPDQFEELTSQLNQMLDSLEIFEP